MARKGATRWDRPSLRRLWQWPVPAPPQECKELSGLGLAAMLTALKPAAFAAAVCSSKTTNVCV